MNELETQSRYPWAGGTAGLSMTWILTQEGLRMRWTQDNDEVPSAVVTIDAARQAMQPALAA